MNNQTYNKLKWVAQILLPALASAYFGLGEIWGLPKVTEIVGTITVLDTFLGVLLGLSSRAYNKSDARFDGSIDIHETEEKKAFLLNLDSDPDTLDEKDEVLFKVRSGDDVAPAPQPASIEEVPSPVKAPRKRAPKKTVPPASE